MKEKSEINTGLQASRKCRHVSVCCGSSGEAEAAEPAPVRATGLQTDGGRPGHAARRRRPAPPVLLLPAARGTAATN